MKEALAIVKLDFVNKDDEPQDFLKVAGNAAQQSASNFQEDPETEAKKFYVRLQIDPKLNVQALDMTLRAGDAEIVSHLVPGASSGVLKSDKAVVLLPPRAESGVEGSNLVGVKVAAQAVADKERAMKGLKGFRLDASATLPNGNALIGGRIPIQVVTEIGWMKDLVMAEDEAAFKVSAAPGFESIPLVVKVGEVEKPMLAQVGNGDTVGVEKDSQEWYDAGFVTKTFGKSGDEVILTIADELPNVERPADRFTVSDHAAYIVDASGNPLGRVFGTDSGGGRRAGGIRYAGSSAGGLTSVFYANALAGGVIDTLTTQWSGAGPVTMTETGAASGLFVSSDGSRLCMGGGAFQPDQADEHGFVWARRQGGAWGVGGAIYRESGLDTKNFAQAGRYQPQECTLVSVSLPPALSPTEADTITVLAVGQSQSWTESGPDSMAFLAPAGAGVLALSEALEPGTFDAVLLRAGSAGIVHLELVDVASRTYVPGFHIAPGQQTTEAPYRQGFYVVKRGSFPGTGVTVKTGAETKTFPEGTFIIPTYGPAQAPDEIQILPGSPIYVIGSEDEVAQGSAVQGGSGVVYDENGNEIPITCGTVGYLVAGTSWRIFCFDTGPEITLEDGTTGKQGELYYYVDKFGDPTAEPDKTYADKAKTIPGPLYFATNDPTRIRKINENDSTNTVLEKSMIRAYYRAHNDALELAQQIQANPTAANVLAATGFLFGAPEGEDLEEVTAAWIRGEGADKILICGGKVITKQMAFSAIGGTLMVGVKTTVAAAAPKVLGAFSAAAAGSAAVVGNGLSKAMKLCTGKWAPGKLTEHTEKHVLGIVKKSNGTPREKEWEIFGGIPGVVISDGASYTQRAISIINAAEKSGIKYRVFTLKKAQKDGTFTRTFTQKIVYDKETKELVIWNETDDVLQTMFRPKADKPTLAEFNKAADEYIEGEIKIKKWTEKL